MLRRVITWFAQLLIGKAQQRPTAAVVRIGDHHVQFVALENNDVPDAPVAGVLHLIEDGEGNYWLAVLRCPCGCGTTIQLPMTPPARPCWYFRGTIQRPSLWPSVRRATGCKSHFVLRNGVVHWCRDS